MKNLSLKLKENIFAAAEKVVRKMKVPRNAYFNEAIEHYNKLHNRAMLKKKLHLESKLVRKESMKVLKEFEMIED